ncbi:hypothetical protein [Ensifer aridi]|uniref:hypothetical protein n=1 Tax=Ensifer aridi TaxID=1708715 RepID=UPI0009BFD5DB|nr:hypothetical protein [Ensifer aridi]
MSVLCRELFLPTRLGLVRFHARVTAYGLTDSDLTLRLVSFDPKLPPGMSVLNCTATLLTLESEGAVQSICLEARIDTSNEASPCTGEYLDAQEWSDGDNLVVIGTEDGAALDKRYPGYGFDRIAVVEFTRTSITLRLHPERELKSPSFHFIVAENPDPEPESASAWFAVDQPHDVLLEL